MNEMHPISAFVRESVSPNNYTVTPSLDTLKKCSDTEGIFCLYVYFFIRNRDVVPRCFVYGVGAEQGD
ncbi:hypothetical protein PAENIP36_21150 [Paenibacillus sp. P36]